MPISLRAPVQRRTTPRLRYVLQLRELTSNSVVVTVPHDTSHQDLIDAIVADVAWRGVGVGRTRAHVLADVRAALEAVLGRVRSL